MGREPIPLVADGTTFPFTGYRWPDRLLARFSDDAALTLTGEGTRDASESPFGIEGGGPRGGESCRGSFPCLDQRLEEGEMSDMLVFPLAPVS
jgi:hypothetical protein